MPDVKLILAGKRTGETEKEKVGRQASEAQLEKELERERKKQRRHILLEEQHEML